ncbi:MAG: hypothetical protein KBD83_03365 [Gammaproteobacteria bacterium]|nr:hypothetical protein [Gammaproteobacteria bacterium]
MIFSIKANAVTPMHILVITACLLYKSAMCLVLLASSSQYCVSFPEKSQYEGSTKYVPEVSREKVRLSAVYFSSKASFLSILSKEDVF